MIYPPSKFQSSFYALFVAIDQAQADTMLVRNHSSKKPIRPVTADGTDDQIIRLNKLWVVLSTKCKSASWHNWHMACLDSTKVLIPSIFGVSQSHISTGTITMWACLCLKNIQNLPAIGTGTRQVDPYTCGADNSSHGVF